MIKHTSHMSRPYFFNGGTQIKNKNVISRAVKENWTINGIFKKKQNSVVFTALEWRERKRD